MNGTGRARWAAVGAAVAVAIGGLGVLTISAAPDTSPATFSPVTPCRLLDTRAGTGQVGPRSTPLAAGETHTVTVRGTNGQCTIPSNATGVSMNITVVNGTAESFLTVFPADVGRPTASTLNWKAGQGATPNAASAPLSADGRLSMFNLAGTVDVIVDIVGYYAPLSDVPEPYRFDASMTLATGANAIYMIDGFGQVPGASDVRGIGWLAPRACALQATVTVVGGLTNANPTLGIALRFSRWDTAGNLAGSGSNASVVPSTPSGTAFSLTMNVPAGQLVTFSQILISGTTVTANTKAYVTATCA